MITTHRGVTAHGFCCGSGTHTGTSTYSVSIGPTSNLDLCQHCWRVEMEWRAGENKRLEKILHPVLPWPRDVQWMYTVEDYTNVETS